MSGSSPHESPLEIGLRKLRRYGGNAVFAEDEANALIDAYDSLEEQLEQRTQNVIDCNARSRALAEKVIGLEEQYEALEDDLEFVQESLDEWQKRSHNFAHRAIDAEEQFEAARVALEQIAEGKTHWQDQELRTAQQIASAALASIPAISPRPTMPLGSSGRSDISARADDGHYCIGPDCPDCAPASRPSDA